MSIIIGTGKLINDEKIVDHTIVDFALGGCKGHKESSGEGDVKPRSTVQVTNVHYGSVSDDLELSGNTVYLRRDVVTATIPAFITKVIAIGEKVTKGEVLYVLESKERKALGRDAQRIDSSLSIDTWNNYALQILQGSIIAHLHIERIDGISPLIKIYNFAEDIQVAPSQNSSRQCCPQCTASLRSMTHGSTVVKMAKTRVKWQNLI